LSNRESKHLLGLDVGSRSVKLIETAHTGGAVELRSIAMAVVEDRGHGPCYQEAIASVLETAGVATKRVATSVCGAHVAVRGFRFPKLAHSELDGAVWYEGSQVIPFDIHEAYVDYSIISGGRAEESKTDVIFVAATRSEVDAKLSLLKACGLEPRVVTVDALALLDAVLQEPDLPETVAVLNIGAANSSIGITHGASLPFIRDIDIAGNTYTQAVAQALGVTHAEAEQAKIAESARNPMVIYAIEGVTRQLVGELSRSLMYYQTRDHGAKADVIFLCGGCSQLPGLADAIAETTSTAVRPWSALDRMRIDESRFDRSAVNELSAFVSLAAALASKEDTN
jgi:type IV pilus assembly protein PilM